MIGEIYNLRAKIRTWWIISIIIIYYILYVNAFNIKKKALGGIYPHHPPHNYATVLFLKSYLLL